MKTITEQFDDLLTLRPESEYHEDMGDVLWWDLRSGRIEEPPYVGTPNDAGQEVLMQASFHNARGEIETAVGSGYRVHVGGWPGYHTHFSPIPKVRVANTLPIPANVYWSDLREQFYLAITGVWLKKNDPFHATWKARASEFPAYGVPHQKGGR